MQKISWTSESRRQTLLNLNFTNSITRHWNRKDISVNLQDILKVKLEKFLMKATMKKILILFRTKIFSPKVMAVKKRQIYKLSTVRKSLKQINLQSYTSDAQHSVSYSEFHKTWVKSHRRRQHISHQSICNTIRVNKICILNRLPIANL